MWKELMKGSVRSVEENILHTRKGNIHYWMEIAGSDVPTIVFLPGLTADRHLFDKAARRTRSGLSNAAMKHGHAKRY